MSRCLSAACLLLVLAAPPAAAVPYDLPFVLGVGQSVDVGDEGVRVGFTRVTGESRCPSGVVCFWPGDAEALLWIELPRRLPESFVLHTYYDFTRAMEFGAWRVELVQVAPYPVWNAPPFDPDCYVVTLRVQRTGAVELVPTAWGAVKARYR